MNRRQAIKNTFLATAIASVLRPGLLVSQEAAPMAAATPANNIYLNPATGADTNSGTKDNPLRTLTKANHVTVQGLKLLGAPVVETPKRGMLVRVYPIGRMGKQLDDLEIAQCLFAGDKVTNPNHLGILANGSGIHVHHCVFYNAKLTVVFWTGGSSGHSMQNCFVCGAYGSGVWTTEIGDDFNFRNNVIANGNYIWTYQSGALAQRDPDAKAKADGPATAPEKQRVHYKVIDSLFAANNKMACSGTGANLGFKDIKAHSKALRECRGCMEPAVDSPGATKHVMANGRPCLKLWADVRC